MIEFTKDLIRRAWLVEDVNGEHTLVEVEYQNYDGTTEKFLAQVNGHEKLPNGDYKWFEIGTTHACTIDGEKAYFAETAEFYAGAVFTLNKKNGIYTRKDELGKGTAKILDKNAKFYSSHMLRSSHFRDIPKLVREHESCVGLTDEEVKAKIEKVQENIRLSTYKEYMKEQLQENRINEQLEFDAKMIENFPGEWIAEYAPIS